MTLALGPKAQTGGAKLFAFDSVGSTNAQAQEYARGGGRGPAWFATTEQTAGKGRRNRVWVAPRGNLACTILQTIKAAPGVAATLGFVAGVAQVRALDAVSGIAGPDYRLKWPNDVLANGAKLVGINLEAEATTDGRLAIWVGIGTNIVAAPQGTPYPATSLAALGVTADAVKLFAALTDHWHDCFALWDEGRGFARIRDLWLARAAGLGDAVTVTMGTTTMTGTFEDLDATGCLVLRMSAGQVKTVTAGDVHFGAAASAGAA